MQIEIPKSEHPLTKITSTAGEWFHKNYLGPIHRTYNVPLPEGIDISDLEVVAEPCDNDGKSLGPAVILKSRTKVKETVCKPSVDLAPKKVEPKLGRKPRAKRKLRDQEIAQDERPTEQSLTAE